MTKIIANVESNQEMRSVLRKVNSCSEEQGVTKETLTTAQKLLAIYNKSDTQKAPGDAKTFLATLESSLASEEIDKLNSNIRRMRKRMENRTKTIELSEGDHYTLEEIKLHVYDEYGQQEITTSEVMDIVLRSFLDGALDKVIDNLYS